MDRTSKFMTDHSEGDKGKEAVMDFQVSWVLRMAADENYTKDKPIFRLYSKFMLFKLLGMPFPNPIQIKKVRVWKEWENIDLRVEVELERNKEIEYHFILIENKIYTNMKTWQRDSYPKTLKQYYDNYPDKRNYKPHYVLITCAEKDEIIEQLKAFVVMQKMRLSGMCYQYMISFWIWTLRQKVNYSMNFGSIIGED